MFRSQVAYASCNHSLQASPCLYTGIPIYNVIGCTYTPLLTELCPGKRLMDGEVVGQPAAITQSRASCPLAKKFKLAGSHSGMSNGTSDVTPLPVTGGPVLHHPPTSKWPVIQSASTAVHSGSRHIRGRSLRNINRRRRRLYQKRKRVAARLRRRCSGKCCVSLVFMKSLFCGFYDRQKYFKSS